MIRKKRRNPEIEMGGQDSFLDLVSNIVGILIILVMIAGIRAQSSGGIDEPEITAAPVQAEPAEKYADHAVIQEVETKYIDLQKKAEIAAKLRSDVDQLQQQTNVIAVQTQRQAMQHAELFDIMTSARAGIEVAAEEKDQKTKEQIETQRQLMETNAKLEQIDKTKTWLQQTRPKAIVMENIPTPLSKTVDDKEVHFRLLGGKVAYVPLMELMLQMQGDIGRDQHKYIKQKTSTGKVGPIDNFELEFLLVTYQVNYGDRFGTRLELEYAEMVPLKEPLGQPLKEALSAPNSDLKRKLSMFRKDIYTITVWVYPDSFNEYQELKQFLYAQGYTVAARPMPMGEPISGSPRGRKSSAQ